MLSLCHSGDDNGVKVAGVGLLGRMLGVTDLCHRLDTIPQLRTKTNKALFRRLACGAALAVSLECAPFVYHQTVSLMLMQQHELGWVFISSIKH